MLNQNLAVEFTGQTSEGLPLVRTLRLLKFDVKNSDGEWVEVWVEPGFVTDFASVPKYLRGIINPWHLRTLLAAILHDKLLVCPRPDFNRLAVDNAFRREMRKAGMSIWARQIRYLGVRIGSGRAYKEARQSPEPTG